MKVCDYITQFFEKNQITKVFSITGGFSMFLNDSFGRNSKFDIYYQHHEQACGYSAIGYSKVKNTPAIVCTTAGCAATNAITPCLVAHQDSVPIIFISGQVKTVETTTHLNSLGKKLRHYSGADSEIINMVKPITKYAIEIYDCQKVPEILKTALFEAINGRPGPVWLSIPFDIQGMDLLEEYVNIPKINKTLITPRDVEIDKFLILSELLNKSSRPVIILGNGIHLSDTREKLTKFVEKYKIPCIVSILGTDLIEHSDENYIGKVGLIGDRAGNFCIQNSDLLISLGCRMSQGIIGYNSNYFAREAKKVMIDIDTEELNKDNIVFDLKINVDLTTFFDCFNYNVIRFDDWRKKCLRWKTLWNNEMPINFLDDSEGINPYYVLNKLYNENICNKITIGSGGSIVTNLWHMIQIKQNDRFVHSSQGDMGFELPAAIGCKIASPEKSVICVVGDGSIQLNIQEFQTIVHNKLPIKVLLFNNSSYGAIKITQNNFFKREFGVDGDSGISFPDMSKICMAYGIKHLLINENKDIDEKLKQFMEHPECVVCEVICCVQTRCPKLSAKKNEDGTFSNRPFEDMEPFLDISLLKDEMCVEMV
jgi:acetolactate synthase-1/2/3 large subunit